MKCIQCGINTKRDQFCSKQCHVDHHKGVEKTVPTCKYCGEKFEAFRKSAKFCSNSCRMNNHNKRPLDRFYLLKDGKKFKLQLVERRVPGVQYVTFETNFAQLIVEKYGTDWQEDTKTLTEILSVTLGADL